MKLRRITKTVSLMMTAILCTQMIIPKTPLIAKASLVEEAAKLDSGDTAESKVITIDVVRGNTSLIQTPEGLSLIHI